MGFIAKSTMIEAQTYLIRSGFLLPKIVLVVVGKRGCRQSSVPLNGPTREYLLVAPPYQKRIFAAENCFGGGWQAWMRAIIGSFEWANQRVSACCAKVRGSSIFSLANIVLMSSGRC